MNQELAVTFNPESINSVIRELIEKNGKHQFLFSPETFNWNGEYLIELCYRLIKDKKTHDMVQVADMLDRSPMPNRILFFKILLSVDYLLSSDVALDQYDKFVKMVISDQGEGRSNYSTHMADQGTDAMEKEILGIVAAQQDHYCKSLYQRIQLLRSSQVESFFYCTGTCGKPIPTVRIIAQRAARKCASCKEKVEKLM